MSGESFSSDAHGGDSVECYVTTLIPPDRGVGVRLFAYNSEVILTPDQASRLGLALIELAEAARKPRSSYQSKPSGDG